MKAIIKDNGNIYPTYTNWVLEQYRKGLITIGEVAQWAYDDQTPNNGDECTVVARALHSTYCEKALYFVKTKSGAYYVINEDGIEILDE